MVDTTDDNNDRDNESINRRSVLKSVGKTSAVGMIGATGSVAAAEGGSDDGSNAAIRELQSKQVNQIREKAQELTGFDTLAGYMNEEGFRINSDDIRGWEISGPNQKDRRVLGIPAEIDDEPIEKATIVATFREDAETFLEGTWVVEPKSGSDTIVTATVNNGRIKTDVVSSHERSPSTREQRATAQDWLPDAECSTCKSVFNLACNKGCDVYFGVLCTGSLIARRACKEITKDMCDFIGDDSDACDLGAEEACDDLGYC
ncbi:hypothetical protein [Natrinema versiforme]|uniref:hypothetical protein n=1 Tax=Natrinema versiforme TaxID=88724 RepID=UPI001268765A|nr:hypothetical protein [Natrinema versiforme]